MRGGFLLRDDEVFFLIGQGHQYPGSAGDAILVMGEYCAESDLPKGFGPGFVHIEHLHPFDIRPNVQVVALVCMLFLMHVRSALVAIAMLPVGVLIAFSLMHLLGLNSNIMSLGGIAIAIGAMVDAAIVMIENAHKHIERALPETPRLQIIIDACKEVGPALFFSLLIITVSFLPVFTLESQEGRMFQPLAFTKTFSMAGAAVLSVTLVPVLMLLFVRGKIMPEGRNPVNRFLIWIYRPVISGVMQWKKMTIFVAYRDWETDRKSVV